MLLNSSQGYKFIVGGNDGWVLNPSESYSHWAHRNRFQVNDTLVFKFKNGKDSVLEVTNENYNRCNVKNPIKSLTEEESLFKFVRSGPHYFISGNKYHCRKGQRLMVVVLAIRPKKSPPAPTHMPTPAPTHMPIPSPTHLPPSTSPTYTPVPSPNHVPTPTLTPSHSSPSTSPTPSSLSSAPISNAPSPSPQTIDGPSSPKNKASTLGSITSIRTLILSVTIGVVCFGAIY